MTPKQAQKSALQAEIQQRVPFASPEVEAYLNLIRTTFQLAGDAAQVCRTAGVSEPQYNVLRILRGAGPEGWPCGEVAARMVSRVPDVSRLLDRMEAAGLIRKTRGKADRRVVRNTITAKGRRVLEKLDGPLVALHGRQLAHLSRRELQDLNRLLVKARGQNASPSEGD